MSIEDEIGIFDSNLALLLAFIENVAQSDDAEQEQETLFLAEAVTFKLFRSYERFIRAAFLDCCIADVTATGNPILSKLKCADWETAEEILKSGNKFLEWGNVKTVSDVSNLVFEEGFPIINLVGPINSTLVDLHRMRNFIAHDSKEAEQGFKRTIDQYIKVGDEKPNTVGELVIYRRRPASDITLRIIYDKISALTAIYASL